MRVRLLLIIAFVLTASCVYAQQDSTSDLNRLKTALKLFQAMQRSSGAGAGSVLGAADPHLLSARTTADVTTDTTLNISLRAGVLVSGTATGPGDQATSISAIAGDGTVYNGNVGLGGQYTLAVNAGGPYGVQTCFNVLGPGSVSSTFTEDLLSVFTDTMLNINLPSVDTVTVSGNAAGLDPAFLFDQLHAVSPDNTTAGTSFLLSPTGDYSTKLPNGPYNFGAFQFALPSFFAVVPLGSATISGDTIVNFNGPPFTTVMGNASGIPIPSNSVFELIDASSPANVNTCNSPVLAASIGPIDSSSGNFSQDVTDSTLYNYFAALPIFPASGSQSDGVLFATGQVIVAGTTTVNVTIPSLAPTVRLAVTITDPNGTPVSGAKIWATSMNITGMANTGFQRSGTTDAGGNTNVDLLSGSYGLLVLPR